MLVLSLSDISVPFGESEDVLRDLCAARLGVPAAELGNLRVRRRALDARHSSRLRYVYTIEVEAPLTQEQAQRISGAKVVGSTLARRVEFGTRRLVERPVVVGAGPAGLFAAWKLAENGYRPILIERGKPVEARRTDTTGFWKYGRLNPDSNVLFGEGGAGAFSDGKLTSRSKDWRRDDVLDRLARCGAGDSVRYEARPHVGTDRLFYVLKQMRATLRALETEILFETRVEDILIDREMVLGVRCAPEVVVPTNALILACGHSARDTYHALRARGVALEQKPFAMGIRVQHRQEIIDTAQYGRRAVSHEGRDRSLQPAEYVLRCPKTSTGRSVFSFCVCPGGAVIPCASEPGGLFCNGMSGRNRGGRFANGAIVAQIPTTDFASTDPLSGIDFQRHWEVAAFESTGGTYALPMMPLVSFVQGSSPPRRVQGLAKGLFPRADLVDLTSLLPPSVVQAVREASHEFSKTIRGWLTPDAVAFGIETRTSSPVRILRREDGQSENVTGLFPAGEGAGYAGGIVSAAVDGMRAAEHLMAIFAPPS